MRRIATMLLPFVWAALVGGPVTAGNGTNASQNAHQPLHFEIVEGRNYNAFYRDGPIAAHMLLRSGDSPRILVAFPAGNSGVALWFEQQDRPVHWTLAKPLEPITEHDVRGRVLRGVAAEILVDASELKVRQTLLGSVRVLRDYETGNTVPEEMELHSRFDEARAVWSRDRLDGAPGYRLSLEILTGKLDPNAAAVRILPTKEGQIRLKIIALTGETPLTPLDMPALLNDTAGPDVRARNALAFLSYEEKFLAGSWRFDTYFGRDTLMSLRLLMPALLPAAVESGLVSVLERLAPNGEVAHEEDIGEFAVLRHLRDGNRVSDMPIFDYGMVDDDFMLAPVAAAYLLDQPMARTRAVEFLGRKMRSGTTVGEALARNFLWVAEQGKAFAAEPAATNLVGLKPGRATGEWRDSQTGLGGGHYPYDINVVLVPAALCDIGRLVQSGMLDPYLTQADRASLAHASGDAETWAVRAPGYFRVSVSADDARAMVQSYAAMVGVDDEPALGALGDGPVQFDALSLDEAGAPIPVVHSDAGFSYLFGEPSAAMLERSLPAMLRPFPAGLMTDVGLLVANPVFANQQLRETLGNGAYHGTVIWAWQQAVLIAGLDRQIARADLSDALRTRLRHGRARVAAAVQRMRDVRTSELWSWSFADGRYQVAPFGTKSADEDESNAAQLWSTVFLAIDTAGDCCAATDP